MEVEGWSQPLPYATFLDELKSAGYEGTELGPYGYLPKDPKILKTDLESRSLTLTSAFVPLRLKDPSANVDAVRAVGELLQSLGARFLVLADALWPEREVVAGRVENSGVALTSDEWRTVVANVSAACRVASEFQLRCVFHHHAGTYIETPSEVKQLLDRTQAGLCLDTGHYVYGRGDPVEAVESFGSRVEYLHFKDVNPKRLGTVRRSQLDFLGGVRAGVFCELGAGCVRFPELLQRLEQIQYDGWAVVEQDVDASLPGSPAPLDSARARREYLRSRLGI